MKKINLSDHFVDKTATLKWLPCHSKKDYRNMQKINEEMTVVRRRFGDLSAKSIIATRRMILRNGR